MATHSSILAWRIPGTGEPGGLPSPGRTESDTTGVTQQSKAKSKGVAKGSRWDLVTKTTKQSVFLYQLIFDLTILM